MEAARTKHYALLSRLLADQSRASDLTVYLSWAKDLVDIQGGKVIEPFIQGLERWLEKDAADQNLQVEYAHLFLLPVGVKPYESTYRSKEKLLMQESWVKVKSFYKECGLKLDQSYNHPEDHAAIELSFMAHLTGSGARKTQRDFFLQHINPWIPHFFEDLRVNPYADFFHHVAEYGLSFLETERNHFSTTP